MLIPVHRWAATLAFLVLLPTVAQARLCAPPTFEGGARLQQRGDDMKVLWLPLLFAQHEVCWRKPAQEGERRVFLSGNSGIFGFGVPASMSVAGVLNSRNDPSVHYFNLGHPYAFQVKDALILDRALAYEPDLIVHSVMLTDFRPRAVMGLRPVREFLDANRAQIARMAVRDLPGLAEPLRSLAEATRARQTVPQAVDDWRQIGRFVRLSAGMNARWWRSNVLDAEPGVPLHGASHTAVGPPSTYDCEAVLKNFGKDAAGWNNPRILSYLADLSARTGTPVVVVSSPVAHLPHQGCYNDRRPAVQYVNYIRWLRRKAAESGLHLLDYHDLLPPDMFSDSTHPNARGHRVVAERLATDLGRLEAAAR